jgi:hypothetical protein
VTLLDELEAAVERALAGAPPEPRRDWRLRLLCASLLALTVAGLVGCAAMPVVTAENYHVGIRWGDRTEVKIHAQKILIERRF